MSPPSPRNSPEYFNVARPAHFRVRGDLIEELCGEEAFVRLLPRDEKQYQFWLSITGNDPKEFPFNRLFAAAHAVYRPTERYVLHVGVLAGRQRGSNILTDGRRWGALVDPSGLFDFVLERAVAFAKHRGASEKLSRQNLFHRLSCIPAPQPSRSSWAVGYERATGLCTILARTGGSEMRYLAGQEGYFTPPFDGGAIF